MAEQFVSSYHLRQRLTPDFIRRQNRRTSRAYTFVVLRMPNTAVARAQAER